MKELPWFKFNASKWLTGDIVFHSLEVQGLFINIVATYWIREGELTLSDIQKRYPHPELIQKLIPDLIKEEDGIISIEFLDELFTAQKQVSLRNSKNGRKGGIARAEKLKPEPASDKPKIDKEAELKRRKVEFGLTLKPFAEIYSEQMLKDFYNYWCEPNKSKTKLKFEMRETWDLKLRLATWKRNAKNEPAEGPIKVATQKPIVLEFEKYGKGN